MLVIYSYTVLTVDHVYRYLLLKGLNLALWVESVTTPREEVSFFSRSSRLSVAWLVCLIRLVFPGASEEGIRKDYLFSQMVYESLRGWSSGRRGEAPPYKYLLSTPPLGRDLSNTISCLTLKIRNRSRGPVDPALLLLITFGRVFSAGGASE